MTYREPSPPGVRLTWSVVWWHKGDPTLAAVLWLLLMAASGAWAAQYVAHGFAPWVERWAQVLMVVWPAWAVSFVRRMPVEG